MAKLKVKQIEDLGIIEVSGENAVTYDAIKIGVNTIAPLTTIIEDTAHSGYISGLTQSGNKIVITRTALPPAPDVTIGGDTTGDFVLNAVVDENNKHQINLTRGTFGQSLSLTGSELSVNGAWVKGLFSVTSESGTGYISGLTYADGVFTPTYKPLTAADVAVAAGIEGLEATNVQGALAELAGDIAALDDAQLSAGKGISITDKKINANFTVDTKKYPTESTAEGYVADKAGKTYIRIMDGTTLISETDAAAFVKDGFLQNVEKDAATNELVFTWNSDAGSQVTRIAISDLCDVYTADETYLHLNGYKFEHKTSGVTATQYAANAADVTVDSTTEKSFKVPTLTVDAAGHVTAASEKTVTIKLPASIDSAIQAVTGSGYVSAETDGTEVSLSLQTQEVADATADANGLATALDVKEYVDSKVAGATEQATQVLELSKVVKGTGTGVGEVALNLVDGYKIEADSVCVYINGQLIPNTGGYAITADSNKVTILANQYDEAGSHFTLESTDRIDVVAHATKTVTLTYLKLQTAAPVTPQA